jgi:hypothetical protein
MKRLLTVVTLLFPCAVTAQTTSEKIYNALETGRIREDEAMQYLSDILENRREAIPENLRSDIPDKCGFPILATLRNASAYPSIYKERQRRSMQSVYVHTFSTPRGARSFQFNFVTTGPDAIPGDDTNGNAIPDWIEEAAVAAERSYRLEVDTLGYREPLNFGIYGFYNIFFLDMDAYGVTYFDSVVTQNPDTYTSSIEIENDFVGFFTTGYNALRVTIAHELHHAIQLSYVDRSGSDLWYYELTSTWMEDIAYDEVNDYYQYLHASFGSPQRSLNICSGIQCGYHITPFFHMIEKKHNRSVIRRSWENFISQAALSALDGALDELTPSNLQTEFVDFSIWNYFTGSRSSSSYYPEGEFYPPVRTEVTRSTADTALTKSLDHLAAHYYTFGLSDSVDAEIVFNSLSASHFNLITIEYKAASGTYFVLNRGNTNHSIISGLLPGDSLTVVVANRNLTGSSTEYAVDLLFTEPSGSGSEAIADVRFFPSPLLLKNSASSLYLRFRLAQSTDVRLEIFSINGKAVHRRIVSSVAAGPHDGRFESEFSWNGKDMDGKRVASGVYIYRLKGDGFEKMGKIAVVR